VAQTCIVHLIRNSLAFASWKERKAILPAIKAIYRAENADMALLRLAGFEAAWGKRYPAIGRCGARRGSMSRLSSPSQQQDDP
jgi:putative transposase